MGMAHDNFEVARIILLRSLQVSEGKYHLSAPWLPFL